MGVSWVVVGYQLFDRLGVNFDRWGVNFDRLGVSFDRLGVSFDRLVETLCHTLPKLGYEYGRHKKNKVTSLDFE